MPDWSFRTPILILSPVNAASALAAQKAIVAVVASARPNLIPRLPPALSPGSPRGGSHAQILVQLVLLALDLLVRDHVDDPPVLDHVVAVGGLRGGGGGLLGPQKGETLP